MKTCLCLLSVRTCAVYWFPEEDVETIDRGCLSRVYPPSCQLGWAPLRAPQRIISIDNGWICTQSLAC